MIQQPSETDMNKSRPLGSGIIGKYFLLFPHKNHSPEKTETNYSGEFFMRKIFQASLAQYTNKTVMRIGGVNFEFNQILPII